MKIFFLVLMLGSVLVFPAKIFAQTKGNGPNYNLQTVETVKGKITSIDTMPSGRGLNGVHLMLKTSKETIPVHLGPLWYLEKQTVQLKVNDRVEVKGSRVMYDNKPTIIAAEVKKGSSALILRDEQGIPKWRRKANDRKAVNGK